VAADMTPLGQFNDFTISYTAPSSGAALGKTLQVMVGGEACVGLDNVRLSDSTVPEPGTIVLLGTGLLGLLAYAWRKRK
jgi:hypothetical protein